MKSKDRQEIFKDERTIQIEHKIGNELAFLAIILLLAYRTRRLEVSIAVHMINNGLPAIIMLLIGIFGMEV